MCYLSKIIFVVFFLNLNYHASAKNISSKLKSFTFASDLDQFKKRSFSENSKHIEDSKTSEAISEFLSLDKKLVQNNEEKNLARLLLTACLIYYHPLETLDESNKMSSEVYNFTRKIHTQLEKFIKSILKVKLTSFDTGDGVNFYKKLNKTILNLKDFSVIFNKYLLSDKNSILDRLIEEYLETDEKYFNSCKEEELLGEDFAQSFLNRMKVLEEKVVRFSGQTGLKKLEEKKQILHKKREQKERKDITAFDIYRKKLINKNYTFSIFTEEQKTEFIINTLKSSVSKDGSYKELLISTLKTIRFKILNIKPLKKHAIKDIQEVLSNENIDKIAEKPEGKTFLSPVKFLVEKISEIRQDSQIVHDMKALVEKKKELLINDALEVISRHLDELSEKHLNASLKSISDNDLIKWEDFQFERKFQMFETTLYKTNEFIKVFLGEDSPIPFDQNDVLSDNVPSQMITRYVIDTIDDKEYCREENAPEIFYPYKEAFLEYRKSVHDCLKKIELSHKFIRYFEEKNKKLSQKDLAPIFKIDLNEKDLAVKALLDHKKLLLEGQNNLSQKELIEESFKNSLKDTFYNEGKISCERALVLKSLAVDFFSDEQEELKIKSNVEQLAFNHMKNKFQKVKRLVHILSEAHRKRFKNMISAHVLAQHFLHAEKNEQPETIDFTCFDEEDFSTLSFLHEKINRLAFIIHSLTIMKKAVSSKEIMWSNDLLSDDKIQVFIDERKLKSAIDPQSMSFTGLEEELIDLLEEVHKDYGYNEAGAEKEERNDERFNLKKVKGMIKKPRFKNRSYMHIKRYLLKAIKTHVKQGSYRAPISGVSGLFKDEIYSIFREYSDLMSSTKLKLFD